MSPQDLYDLIKALPRYSFPSSVDDESTPTREDLGGLWRTPREDGSVCVPIGYASAVSSAPVSTFSSAGSTVLEKNASGLGLSTSSDETKSGVHVCSSEHKYKTEEIHLAPGYCPPERSVYDYAPVLLVFRPLLRRVLHEKKQHRQAVSSNIPLEIQLYLSSYLATCIKRATIPATVVSPAFAALNQLADSLATMERGEDRAFHSPGCVRWLTSSLRSPHNATAVLLQRSPSRHGLLLPAPTPLPGVQLARMAHNSGSVHRGERFLGLPGAVSSGRDALWLRKSHPWTGTVARELTRNACRTTLTSTSTNTAR